MTHKNWERGDHIYFKCGGYTHHGIYCGDDRVIHYGRKKEICETSLSDFAKHRDVSAQKYEDADSADIVVSRAKERLSERKYNLLFNNCEHFATWCKVGRRRSRQIKKLPKTAIKFLSHHGHKFIKEVGHQSEKPLKILSKKAKSTSKSIL